MSWVISPAKVVRHHIQSQGEAMTYISELLKAFQAFYRDYFNDYIGLYRDSIRIIEGLYRGKIVII